MYHLKILKQARPNDDVHHIVTRGAGGDDDLANLICLCRECHNNAGKIGKQLFREILSFYYGYIYGDCND